MNNDYAETRIRNKTLIVVEGEKGEIKLMSILAKSFPELRIDPDKIIVYKSNLYILYHELYNHYVGNKIDKDDDGEWLLREEIDLPLVLSKAGNTSREYSSDYSNIIYS